MIILHVLLAVFVASVILFVLALCKAAKNGDRQVSFLKAKNGSSETIYKGEAVDIKRGKVCKSK